MKAVKRFPVFAETIDIHVTSAMSNGASSVLVSIVPPGGGPPPHIHQKEDEIFTALEGEFELLVDGAWVPLTVGVPTFAGRGRRHAFRNAGKTDGRLQVVAAPGGVDEFLEQLSPLTQTMDMPQIVKLAQRYGIAIDVPPGPQS